MSTNINSTPGRREERTEIYGVSYDLKSSKQPTEGCLSRADDWTYLCFSSLPVKYMAVCLQGCRMHQTRTCQSCKDEKSVARSAATGSVLPLTHNSNGALG